MAEYAIGNISLGVYMYYLELVDTLAYSGFWIHQDY